MIIFVISLTFTGEVFLNSGTAFKASKWNCCVEGRKLTTNNPFFNSFLFSFSIIVSNDWNKDTNKYKTVFLLSFDYGNIKTTYRFKPWKVLKFKTFRNIKQRANFLLQNVDKFLNQIKIILIARRIYFFVSYRWPYVHYIRTL